jgi:hypothetical protein
MLVRNNIPCPTCGKVTTVDIYVYHPRHILSENYVEVRILCSDCLHLSGMMFGLAAFHYWFRRLFVEDKRLGGEKCLRRLDDFNRIGIRMHLHRDVSRWMTPGVPSKKYVEQATLDAFMHLVLTSGIASSGTLDRLSSYAWRCL